MCIFHCSFVDYYFHVSALGRIGKFAARRNRLTRSGVSPMGSVASGLDEDLLSMDSASQTNQHHARQSLHESNYPGIVSNAGSSSGISNSQKPICLYVLCEKQMTKVSICENDVLSIEILWFLIKKSLYRVCGDYNLYLVEITSRSKLRHY